MTHRSFIACTALAAAMALASAVGWADPTELSAQGRLTATGGGPIADGSYPMAVALYDQPVGGAAVFKEFYLGTAVQGGVFSLMLGAADAKLDTALFANGKPLYVGVTVGTEPELPRQKLARVPYAVHAWLAAQSQDVACSGCVGSDDLAKGAVTGDKVAVGAIGANHVNFNYAGSDSPGGAAAFALSANNAKQADNAKIADVASFADEAAAAKTAKTADTAKSADTAKAADTAKSAESAKSADTAKALACTGCVGTGEHADKSVTKAKLADGAVGTDQIADGSVTAAKLAANAGVVPTAAMVVSLSPYDTNLLGAGYKLTPYTVDLKAERNWKSHKALPTGRLHPTVAVVKNKAYVIGGGGPAHFDGGVTTNEMYDPDTDSWTKKADMPTARGWNPWVVINDIVYVAGGLKAQTPLNVLEAYDPATDKWTNTLPTKPSASGASWGIAYGGKGYFFAGTANGNTDIYDPVANKWTVGAARPSGADEDHCAAEVDGKLYVIGGAGGTVDRLSFQRYDPVTNAWEDLGNMPSGGVTDGWATVAGHAIYVWGGWDNFERRLRIYDTDSQTWSVRPTFVPPVTGSNGYNRFKIAMLNGRAYFMGGATSTAEGVPYNTTVMSFGPLESYLYTR